MRFKKPKPVFRQRKISSPQAQPTGRTAIPAHCGQCGALFATTGIVALRAGAQVTFSGCGMRCPRCGGGASILDGTFERTSSALRLLSGPQFTKEVLRAFGALIEQAERKEISTEDLQKQASELDVDLGRMVAEAIHSRWGLVALVVLLLCLKTCHFNINVDLNNLWDQTFRSGVVHQTSRVERKEGNARLDRSSDRLDATGQSTALKKQ